MKADRFHKNKSGNDTQRSEIHAYKSGIAIANMNKGFHDSGTEKPKK